MSEEQAAKLIAMYWEAWDKSSVLRNYQRGIKDVPAEYYAGYSDALNDVMAMFDIMPEIAIPPQIKADMDERRERMKPDYARYGIDLDALTGRKPKQEDQ